MKQIDKTKFAKRIKDAEYLIQMRYDNNANSSEIGCMRNGKVMQPSNLTDEDIILLSQMIDSASETFHRMLCERDLVPDIVKDIMNQPLTKPTAEA